MRTNHSTKRTITESQLRFATSILLWGISAALTFSLYLSMGDGSATNTAVLLLTAVALEAAKLLLWRMAGGARVLAIVLIVLSGVASLGAALKTVEGAKGRFFSTTVAEVKSSAKYKALEADVLSVDGEIKVQVARLAALPPDYVSAGLKLSASVADLRTKKQGLLNQLSAMEATAETTVSAADSIALLARTVHLPPESVLLFLLLLVSGCIEAAALVLSKPVATKPEITRAEAVESVPSQSSSASTIEGEIQPPTVDRTRPTGKEDFLRAAMEGSDLPFLHGRDRTAKTLGIAPGEAKRLVRGLIADGIVRVEGKRLRLAKEA